MNKITCYNEVVEHTPPAILLSLKKKKWVVRLKLRISILYHNLEKNLWWEDSVPFAFTAILIKISRRYSSCQQKCNNYQ